MVEYVKVADYLEKRNECPDCDIDQEKFSGVPMNHCITCQNISNELKEIRSKLVHFQKLTPKEQIVLERNWKPPHLRKEPIDDNFSGQATLERFK